MPIAISAFNGGQNLAHDILIILIIIVKPVVCLPKRPHEPVERGGEDHSAVAALLHVRPGGPGHPEGAAQVHPLHQVPVGVGGARETAIESRIS